MSLERKDVRFKLDPDQHARLSAIHEVDGVELAEIVERVVIEYINRRVSDANLLHERLSRLGITGRDRE